MNKLNKKKYELDVECHEDTFKRVNLKQLKATHDDTPNRCRSHPTDPSAPKKVRNVLDDVSDYVSKLILLRFRVHK